MRGIFGPIGINCTVSPIASPLLRNSTPSANPVHSADGQRLDDGRARDMFVRRESPVLVTADRQSSIQTPADVVDLAQPAPSGAVRAGSLDVHLPTGTSFPARSI